MYMIMKTVRSSNIWQSKESKVNKKGFFKKYTDVIVCFLVSRLCFALILILCKRTVPELTRFFDGELYYEISVNGYNKNHLTAFFPLIPLIYRYLTGYGLLVVNQICLFISMVILKKIISEEYKCPSASAVILVFAFSPVSYFSLVAYTESVFFVLTLSAFYLFMKNKYPLLMGILLGLSVFTRNTGSIVFFALFIGMVIRWIKKQTKFWDIVIAYVPATLISLIFPVYLQVKFGNWKVFVDCQYENWLKVHSNFFKTYYSSFKMIFTNEYNYDIYTLTLFRINEIITILITLFLLFLCVKEIKKLKKFDPVSVVSVLVILMSIVICSSTIMDPAESAPTRSFYRYYLGMFPAFTLLYSLHPKLIDALVVISAFSGLVLSAIYFKASFFY